MVVLSKQEVVNKLDTIPTFHLENIDKKIFPVPDESGETCVRWFADMEDAQSALDKVQALNPDMTLRLGVTPMGTAFALAQGWSPNGAEYPLKLHASKKVVQALAVKLGATPSVDDFPLYSCEELTSDHVMPFWLSAADVKATWIAAERPEDKFPDELILLDLQKLVRLAMTSEDADWSKLMLVASEAATNKAQELQETEEQRLMAGLADEPPPLD